MTRRNYILAGNYLMLDNLYSEKAALEKQNKELTKQLSVHKQVIQRLKKLVGYSANVIDTN